jgi:hypothetical protein
MEIPDRFPPQMFRRRTIPEVKIDIYGKNSIAKHTKLA